MAEFKIKPEKKESINRTVRFPADLGEEISAVAQKNDVSFSSFVIQACQFALDNMAPSDLKKK